MSKIHTEIQKEKINDLTAVEKKSFFVFPTTFLQSMREVPYRNPAWAFAELSDNSIEAWATTIEIIFREGERSSTYDEIAHVCNGHGIHQDWMKYAMAWGGTTRDKVTREKYPGEEETGSLGRFGFGMPSAALWMARKWTVYSRADGQEEMYKCTFDLDLFIEKLQTSTSTDELDDLIKPEKSSLPKWILNKTTINTELKRDEKGNVSDYAPFTAIVLEDPDHLKKTNKVRSAVRRISSLSDLIKREYGRIYSMNFPAVQFIVNGEPLESLDPFFINPDGRYYHRDPEDPKPEEPHEKREVKSFEFTKKGKKEPLKLTYGYIPRPFVRVDPNGLKRSAQLKTRFGVLQANQGIMLRREGRLIDVIKFPGQKLRSDMYGFQMEIDFPSSYDDLFDIGTRKERASLPQDIWDALDGKYQLNAYVSQKRKEANELDQALNTKAQSGADSVDGTESGSGKEETMVPKPTGTEKTIQKVVKVTEERKNLKPKTSRQRRQLNSEKVSRIEEKQKEKNITEEEAKQELFEEVKSKPFHIELKHVPDGPFIRPAALGFADGNDGDHIYQTRLEINTAHIFYAAFYDTLSESQKQYMNQILYYSTMGELYEERDGFRVFCKEQRLKWSSQIRKGFEEYTTYEDAAERNELLQELETYEKAQDDGVFAKGSSFGACIRQLRSDLGLTQTNLAEKLKDVKGINQAVLSKLEKDDVNLNPEQRQSLYTVLELDDTQIETLDKKWSER